MIPQVVTRLIGFQQARVRAATKELSWPCQDDGAPLDIREQNVNLK
jgi:hypothetical protein